MQPIRDIHVRFLTPSMRCRPSVAAFALLVSASSLLVAPAEATSKPAMPTPTAYAAVSTCPFSTSLAATKIPVPAAVDDKSCLIAASAIASSENIFDLRDRAEFLEFHVPGAQSATAGSLSAMPAVGGKRVIVYDSGRFRADAFQICRRLRSAGITQVKVVDGGIAAWAQLHARSQTLRLNRLSDAEIPAALSNGSGTAVVLAESLRPSLRHLGVKPLSAATARPLRAVVLADDKTSTGTIQAQLTKSTAAFYWRGTADRLDTLLRAHLAQDRKRVAGPGESTVCGAL